MKNRVIAARIRKVTATAVVAALAIGMTGCQLAENNGGTTTSTAAETTADVAAADTAGTEDAATEVKQLKIGISSTSSNNHYFTEDGTETGFEYELIKALDEALPQYEISIITEEFSSLFVSLDSGTVDAVIGNLRRSDEREEGYIHTYYAYNYSPYRVMVEDTDDSINSLDDLDGKKLGISQGSMQAAILEEYQADHGISIEYVYTKDYTTDLVSGKIDAFIAPEFTLEKYNESFEDVKFKITAEEVNGVSGTSADANTYIYLAQGSEDLRDELSEAIYQLREDGTISALSTEFFDEDYSTRINTEAEAELLEAAGK